MRFETTAGDRPISRPAIDMLPVRATRANMSKSLIAVTLGSLGVTILPAVLGVAIVESHRVHVCQTKEFR
jgi:hypothetical protein